MLAGRLIRVAKDILGEYSQFQIIEQLTAASNLSSRRGQPQPQYVQQARSLRDWARKVMNETKIEKYPQDILKFIKESKYSSALPEHLARLVMNGLPDDPNIATASSEFNLYVQLAASLRSELGALVTAADKLNLDEIKIPENQVSFDIIIPRAVFGERADSFIDVLSRFTRIMSYLIEFTTGSEGSPTITYTSTSDLVTGLAVVGGAAWAFLRFYKLALEVVEKHISLSRTLKEFRAGPLRASVDNFEEQIKTIMDDTISRAVTETLASVPRNVPDGRVNEIKIAINKDAPFAVQAILDGTRVGITIDSLDRTSLITEAVPEATPQAIDEIVKEQKTLENQVERSLVSLGETPLTLLPVKNHTGGAT
jgi:hypothetical protein